MTLDPPTSDDLADDADATTANAAQGKQRSRMFRSTKRVPLDPDIARRQGEITKYAFLTLGSSAAAIGFLNAAHDDLGARPLDVAMASNDGFATVQRLIEAAAAKP